jgi:hypothetical protein
VNKFPITRKIVPKKNENEKGPKKLPPPLGLKAVNKMANVELIADASAKYRICTIFTFDSTMSAMEPQKFFILRIQKKRKRKNVRK